VTPHRPHLCGPHDPPCRCECPSCNKARADFLAIAPAPAERVVTGCRECPWFRRRAIIHPASDPGYCAADAANREADGVPPDWCPLRRAPVLVRLETP